LREVEIAGRRKRRVLGRRQQRHQQRLDVPRRQHAIAIGDELTAHTQHRRIARRQVEVGAALLE